MMRVLASGHMVWVDDVTGIAEFMTCPWLVRVPSNNPEPDFPSDCWREVECGARWLAIPGNPSGWRCENGHQHRGIEIEWVEDAR